jgi:Polyketide cyclase / dehydrase and lipid transport
MIHLITKLLRKLRLRKENAPAGSWKPAQTNLEQGDGQWPYLRAQERRILPVDEPVRGDVRSSPTRSLSRSTCSLTWRFSTTNEINQQEIAIRRRNGRSRGVGRDSRRPEDVFSYVADLSHHPEWIDSVVSAHRVDNGPLAVGSRVQATRRAGPWKLRYTEEMSELNPPKSWANHGVSGSVIAYAKGTVEPLEGGRRRR